MAPTSIATPTTSVQVALRIRPTTSQDATSIPARFQRTVIHATSQTSVSVDASSSAPSSAGPAAPAAPVASTGKKQVFNFDQVHGPATTQHTMFTSTAQSLISRFVEGFNCTILAYGQTSSGKTFTMTGVDLEADPSDPGNDMGIIPRAVSTIFSRARQLKEERGGAWHYSIKGSFIELYNEDLIDLLSMDDTSGGRREVQIREDKDGHIIWGGLREVNVKSSPEVMNLIRQGTAIRRTNETDMNAQSSRSHAIFSLTLTQRKYTGSGPPPRSSSPLPPGGRSPSRLARPGSIYTGAGSTVASPTFGRPATPSFASAIGRGGGLRPSSALGMRSGDARDSIDEDTGEWKTVVSKFHFVDLAGSERLKRTAAAGERIKEGISINSGLLALGNVISALGDPSRAKSHTASHVPYRDSKLTRLLQDSLGGNAHTLMIACVSPAEWNAGETVNTLKYANRARNIKNRAVVNEREDGWDDIEWLQGMVTRLRKELKVIKETGGVVTSGTLHGPEVLEGAGKKVLAQMTVLQNNYEDLREKFVERTEELTRLRRELGVKQRGSLSGAVGGTAKYEEIVGPVIEEYEKAIGAMEAELSLNRAALRHTNEMVEEKEEALGTVMERHSATELYVEELRARVAKLSERESSTEAYVRDLEEKIKTYDESSVTSSESMTDLKREVARFRDTESHSGKYIADLEARLARSDESVLALQQAVERLERVCERRQEEVVVLQTRLDNLTRDGDSWRSDLELRERRVKELEAKMGEWEKKRKSAGEERLRLGSVVGEVAEARRSMEAINGTSTSGTVDRESGMSSPNNATLSLESQLVALQETHTATLADLSSVTSKYRDALHEISDLAAQIQEAKLSSPTPPLPESPLRRTETLPARRRTTGSRVRDAPEPQFNGAGRRLFFRQAASSESLHSRSLSQSQSLSQELSSARSRKRSTSSHGTSSSMSHSPTPTRRPTLTAALPSPSVGSVSFTERTVTSMEKEIMRLQEVLKEREAEISMLEESLRESQKDDSAATFGVNGDSPVVTKLSPQTLKQFDVARDILENGHDYPESGSVSEHDESLDRLNELMLSMAQKESHHREVVEELNSQLSQVRRQYDDLTALSRDQALNMSTELEALRSKHDDDLTTLEQVQQHEVELIEALNKVEADHISAVESLRNEYEDALQAKAIEVDNLQKSHEEVLRERVQEVNDALNRTLQEHETVLTTLRDDHEEQLKRKEVEATAILQRTEEDYYNVLTKLRGDHAEILDKQAAEAAASLERLREDHTSALRMAEIAREGSLSESESSRNIALQELQNEHSAAITRKEASFTEELERLKAEHARALTTITEDHNLALDKQSSEHEGVVARQKEEARIQIERLTSALKKQQAASTAESAKAREELTVAVQTLQQQQVAVLKEVESGHQEEVSKLKDAHAAAIRGAELEAEQHRSTVLRSHSENLEQLKSDHEALLKETESTAEQLRASLEDSHASALSKLQTSHEIALRESKEVLEKERTSLIQSHKEEVQKLKTQHQQAIAEVNSRLLTERDQHHVDLQDARTKADQQSKRERNRHTESLAEMEKQHSEERETLRKDHELLVQELEAHKAAASEFTVIRDESRNAHEKAENELSTVRGEREVLEVQVERLRAELDKTRNEQSKLIQEASKRESLVSEVEKHRSMLADVQEILQRVKDEKDSLQSDKTMQDTLVKELQAQLARGGSPTSARPDSTQTPQRAGTADRSIPFPRTSGNPKFPPPTPPPAGPPPPPPKVSSHVNGIAISASSHASSGLLSSTSSRESQLESPPTSAGQSLAHDHAGVDPRLEEQAKHIEEQDAMIKTLNKQLTHCESDLQTHMDLVGTLETSLGEAEKNLRKARMHATELARERDGLNSQIQNLRGQLSKAESEVVTVRSSIAEEKHSLEARLDEERRAKERARQQLDSRMDELQKRKSKFACL